MVAGVVAYALGGIQLDVTALIAKAVEGLALVMLLLSIIRTGREPEPEGPVPQPAVAVGARPVREHSAGRGRRSRGGGRPSRRRAARRTGA